MSAVGYGSVMLAGLMAMMAARVPIGAAMFFTGCAGYFAISGGESAALLANLKNLTFARLSNYDLVVVPMFLLMGQFATHGGLSRSLYRCAGALIGHWRGGVAMASIGACAGFGAICGSSLATAATMGQVALPELRRLRYAPGLATGTLAAGGTLGILIPPSVPLVIYAILTQESIGKLFVAAVFPGILAMVGYMVVVRVLVTIDPASGPAGRTVPWKDRLLAVYRVWPVVAVFVVVIVGIYDGWANPTEAAAIGAAACGVLAIVQGMRLPGLILCAEGTARTSAMILLVLLGADILNSALALSQVPVALAGWVAQSGMPPLAVLAAILLIYLFLGCVMDSLAMILLTIPIFYPMVMGLDFWGLSAPDKSIWFGILALMVVEILVTPPVGMNIFIINKLAGDVPLKTSFRGVAPFLVSDAVRVACIVFFPGLALWLVNAFNK